MRWKDYREQADLQRSTNRHEVRDSDCKSNKWIVCVHLHCGEEESVVNLLWVLAANLGTSTLVMIYHNMHCIFMLENLNTEYGVPRTKYTTQILA